MKETEYLFYEQFVNEDNFQKIENPKTKKQVKNYSIVVALFSMVASGMPLISGYNFTHAFSITMLVFLVFFCAGELWFSIKLIFLDRKHRIFKKPWYCLLFMSTYIFLTAAFDVIAIFSTKLVAYENGSFSVFFNPMVIFFIYFPVYIAYIIFCYFSYMKCFGKIVKKNL